jgi:hypothetical protein
MNEVFAWIKSRKTSLGGTSTVKCTFLYRIPKKCRTLMFYAFIGNFEKVCSTFRMR